MDTLELLNRVEKKRIWDTEPVFCFTSDIDWASEAVTERCLSDLCAQELKLTVFVTHESRTIDRFTQKGLIQRGLHPNFLSGSSHGEGFRTVVENCLKYAPEAQGFRSHRCFDVTDVTHLLHDQYGFKYVSNLVTIMQPGIAPIVHESGLIHYPVFFEDGTHLFNKLSFNLSDYLSRFLSPGIKIISIHPMNYVINPPEIKYMRNIKDSLSRTEYALMTLGEMKKYRYMGIGIKNLLDDIILLAKKHRIMFLDDIYQLTIS
jgi:hypothetical protein